MSLINEALKRAKQAQDVAPPAAPPSLEFRPVDPAKPRQRNQSVVLIAALSTIVVLAVLLVWMLVQNKGSGESDRAKRPDIVAHAAPAPAAPAPAPIAAAPPAAEPEKTAPSLSSPQPTPTDSTADALKVASAQGSEPGAAQAADTAVEPAQPAKPTPKLQSIVYNPKRPSAMISGKVVFIGDKFGDWRIAAIDQESATLVSSGATNILVLQQ